MDTAQIIRGVTGGMAPERAKVVYGRRGGRAALQAIEKCINDGVELSDSEMAKSIKFAVQLRDAVDSSPRDRLRAIEFLDGVIARGVNVSLAIASLDQKDEHKQSDIDRGADKTNVNVNVGIGVKFIKGVEESAL